MISIEAMKIRGSTRRRADQMSCRGTDQEIPINSAALSATPNSVRSLCRTAFDPCQASADCPDR